MISAPHPTDSPMLAAATDTLDRYGASMTSGSHVCTAGGYAALYEGDPTDDNLLAGPYVLGSGPGLTRQEAAGYVHRALSASERGADYACDRDGDDWHVVSTDAGGAVIADRWLTRGEASPSVRSTQ